MVPIIDIVNVDFSYKPKLPILNNVSATILPGQLITLLGPNGVGKSTLLNCITGLLSPLNGRVELNGEQITKMSKKQIAQNVAYVPQKTAVSFDYSVMDFILMGRTSHMGFFSTPKLDDYKIAEDALQKLDILNLKDRQISELSGGEQQKVCIVRAIVQNPKLIIMDEPTSALDYGNQIKVLKLVKQLSSNGYSVLITTHNPEHPLLLKSDVWILNKEGHLEYGTYESMITEPRLSELYDSEICITEVASAKRKACIIRSL